MKERPIALVLVAYTSGRKKNYWETSTPAWTQAEVERLVAEAQAQPNVESVRIQPVKFPVTEEGKN